MSTQNGELLWGFWVSVLVVENLCMLCCICFETISPCFLIITSFSPICIWFLELVCFIKYILHLICLHYFLYFPSVSPSLAFSCVILIFIKASQLFGRLVILHCIIWSPVNHCLLMLQDFVGWQLLCCWTLPIWLAFMKIRESKAPRDTRKNTDMNLKIKGRWTRKWRVMLDQIHD